MINYSIKTKYKNDMLPYDFNYRFKFDLGKSRPLCDNPDYNELHRKLRVYINEYTILFENEIMRWPGAFTRGLF